LDFVPGKARKARLNCALINVRGLGGGNSSMVVERVQDNIGGASVVGSDTFKLNRIFG